MTAAQRDDRSVDVLIVGGGVAGRSAAIFTARHGLDTLVIDAGGSLVRRNAHLENFPGFPAGVNARQLLDLMADQATRAGSDWLTATVTDVTIDETGFQVETDANTGVQAASLIVATKNEVAFVEHLDGVSILDRGKTYIETDERGRTDVDGLYAAGRVAHKPHQAIVCAGHGAEVAVTLLEDHEAPFYHDWVAPTGYFTERGRDVPPGCEEIDAEERTRREQAALEEMQAQFEEPHPDPQETHPSLI